MDDAPLMGRASKDPTHPQNAIQTRIIPLRNHSLDTMEYEFERLL